MANTSRANGLTPVQFISGAPWNAKGNLYYIFSTYGTAAYVGDVVKLVGSADARGIPSIELAAAGENFVGVITGFVPRPAAGLENNYSPLSTEGYAYVCDDPNVIFEAQVDTIAVTDFSNNADIVVVAGSTSTMRSATYIQNATINTTNTLAFRLLRLVDREDNAVGAYAKILVLPNIHQYKVTTGVTGV